MEAGVDIIEGSPSVGEEKIFVAVGNVLQENLSTLYWALKNFRKKNICILHVHQPAQMIGVLGGRFRAEVLDEQRVKADLEEEKEKMLKSLKNLCDTWTHAGLIAGRKFIENDNIKKGIVEYIVQNGITKLVMGAAADRHSRNLKKLRSVKAKFVYKKAPISCHIWFVCKGNLIVTRPEGITPSPLLIANTISSGDPEQSRTDQLSRSISHIRRVTNIVRNLLPGGMSSTNIDAESAPPSLLKSQSKKKGVLADPAEDPLEGPLFHIGETSMPRTLSSSSSSSSWSSSSSSSSSKGTASIETSGCLSQNLDNSLRFSNCSSAPNLRDDKSVKATGLPSRSVSCPADGQSMVEESKSLNVNKEKKGRKEKLKRYREELKFLKSQLVQVKDELRVVEDQKLKHEAEIADSNRMVEKTIENLVLSAARQLGGIQKEIDELQKLRIERMEESTSLQRPQQYFSVFSAFEIESATKNFDPSMMIREEKFGNVYGGTLRQTHVAIKRLHSHCFEGNGSSDFQREVDILSKVRHQNIITLIGVCPEASSLVLEYLPNGSLEDRLTCKDGTPPLSWKTRICIAKEICSALIFLHFNDPQIVHGYLKPSNILLDGNFVSKLGDFGYASFIIHDNDDENSTDMGDPNVTTSHIDPALFATGVLTTKADVHSFGVILLRLLTGKPRKRLPMNVQFALDKGNLNDILDSSAGDWPLYQAKQLAQIASRCCKVSEKDCPNLELEVSRLLLLLDVNIYV